MDIKDLVQKAHANSVEHGFWDQPQPPNYAEKLALIHSEVSEVLECMREEDGSPFVHYRGIVDGRKASFLLDYAPGLKPEGVLSELADVMIRVGDLVGGLLDGPKGPEAGALLFDQVLQQKMAYNAGRPKMHGKKF